MAKIEETQGYSGVSRDLEIGKPEVRVRIDGFDRMLVVRQPISTRAGSGPSEITTLWCV